MLATLPQRGGPIVHDALVHAGAITRWRGAGSVGTPWIAIESLYSMDGGRAPLADLVHIADYVVTGKRRLRTTSAMEVPVPDSGYLTEIRPRLLARFRQRNLLLRPLGITVYVMAPYCIDEIDSNTIYDSIPEALEDRSGT